MSEPFLGEIRLVGFNFAPTGWALCEGQLLAINQNVALFSVLGTMYGGNGTTNFALPDLRGRVPMSFGQGPGLSNFVQGQILGAEHATLDVNHMPAHSHAIKANGNAGNTGSPIGAFPAAFGGGLAGNATTATGVMNAAMVAPTGGGQAFDIHQPSLVLNWIIALQGIFPSRS